MLEERDIDKSIFYGILFTTFFIAGFLTSGLVQDSPAKDTITSDKQDKQPKTSKISKQEAVSNAETYLKKGPLSYPFTYNISTVSIKEEEIGGNNFYNWTFSYTVEANPIQGATYQVPGNQTKAQKQMTVYITPDGTSLFPSQPIKINR